MVKSGKSFAKIGSRFQIAFTFLFTEIFNHPSLRPLAYSDHPVYFILSNFPIPVLIRTPPPFIRDPRVPSYEIAQLYDFGFLNNCFSNSLLTTTPQPATQILWNELINKCQKYIFVFNDFWNIFFPIRIFFHRHWRFTEQGKAGDHLSLPLPPADEHPVTYLQLCMWHDCRMLLITSLVTTGLLLCLTL